jgi:flagellar basal-body rod modification protein FlgD
MQNKFMTLLVTQMKNQNPLNPMDNAQVTSQLAQLSTVSGINQLNSSLTNLTNSFQTSQNMQATNLIGKSVVVPGNAITLGASGGQYGVSLASPASDLKVTISDSSGNVVNKLDLGSYPGGVSAIPWDGKTSSGTVAPTGQYTFTVTATNGASTVAATPLSVGLVTSISAGATGALLNIPSVGQVNFSNVVQIL